MKWTLEDYTKKNAGYLSIFCDGQRAADVFPFAKGVDAQEARWRAVYMVAALNMANEETVRIAIAS